MAAEKRWFFTKEQLENSPSRRCGYDAAKELSCRQQAANLIQDMGQRLHVNQLCINTAMVYMHRFFVFHSFTHFHRNAMATAALFLACKVEEQPRKLEYVIKVSQLCLMKNHPPIDVRSEEYLQQAADLVMNENVLLQTLGFDVGVDHPHTHIVRCCHLVNSPKDLAQTSYFMATNSLHLTTMCLQYKATVVACFCIHLACKWSNWEIPQSNEGKPWFWYVDKTVTPQLLEQLTSEFLSIFDKCPSRLKKRIYQQNSQNSLSSKNFSFDMAASQKSLSNTNSGVSFQQPINLAEQPQGSSSVSSGGPLDKRREREQANITSLRQSYGQPVSSSLHKKVTSTQNSLPKEFSASHSNAVKHPEHQQQQQQLHQQQQPDVKAHPMSSHYQAMQSQQHHLSGRQNSVAPVKVKLEPGQQKMNSVSSQDDQHSNLKASKVGHMPSLGVAGGGSGVYPRNGTLPHPSEHGVKDYIKKEPSESHHNASSHARVKVEPSFNSSEISHSHSQMHPHYQKHNSSSSDLSGSSLSGSGLSGSHSSEVIKSVLKEVISSSFTSESSLSQNSVQSQQETVKVKQERLSPIQTQKSHSIFSPELRSPPPKYESILAQAIKKETVEGPQRTQTPATPTTPATPATPLTPTNSHKRTPVVNTPELVPVVPRLESMTGFKNIIDKNQMSVMLSHSNDVANSTTYVPTNNSGSIASSAHSEYKWDSDNIDGRVPGDLTSQQSDHYMKSESSCNNSVAPLSISGSSHHKKKKKNKDKDKSKHREHKSEHKKHHKKHKEKDKRRDKEKEAPTYPKIIIKNDPISASAPTAPEPIKITIPKKKLQNFPSTSSLKLKLSSVPDDRQRDRHKDRDRDRERDRDRDFDRDRGGYDGDRDCQRDHDPSSLKLKISTKNSSRKRERSYDEYSSSSSAPASKKYFQE